MGLLSRRVQFLRLVLVTFFLLPMLSSCGIINGFRANVFDSGFRQFSNELNAAYTRDDATKFATLLEKRGAFAPYITMKPHYLSFWLVQAARDNKGDIAKSLLDRGADPNTKTTIPGFCESSVLLDAADDGSLELIKVLLAHGADPHTRDCRSKTALIRAAQSNRIATMQFFISSGASPNETADGVPVLFYALFSVPQNTDAIYLLLKAGADPNAKRRILLGKEQTALSYAKMIGDNQIIELLKNAGARE